MAVNEITNTAANAKVAGTSGKDSIVTSGNYTTVTAGDGDDTISNENGHTSRILGEGGNDSIYNGENSNTTTLDGGAGDDSIRNFLSNYVKIIGGDGNDYIFNEKSYLESPDANSVTVLAGNGNDTIISQGNNCVLNGEAGDDFIHIKSNSYSWMYSSNAVKAIGGNGNDTLINEGKEYRSNTLDGGAGDDVVENYRSNASVNAGTGNDFVVNSGENVTIESSAGNNKIRNEGTNARISMGTGNDTIYNRGSASGSIIDGGDGSDLIENAAGSTSINGGAGVDSISNTGSNVSINGGDGNDTIDNGPYYASVENVTITGGAGNDNIILGGDSKNNLIQYTDGDGKDLVTGFNETSSLKIGDGEDDTYASVKSGSDIIVTVGKGNITLQGAANLTTVNILGKLGTGKGDTTPPATTSGGGGNDTTPATTSGGGGNDTTPATTSGGGGSDTQSGGGKDTQSGSGGSDTTSGGENMEDNIISNKTSKVSVAGTAYDDEIYNRANKVTMTGGNGNDMMISLRKTASVKMYGGEGDDTLESYSGTKILLDGGAGNDEIYSSGKQNTVVGGAGKDTIEIDSTNTQIQYKSGDGNDLVTGFNETTSLKIGNGTTDTYYSEKVGEDVIVTVGDGAITLEGAANLWVDTLNDGQGGLSNIQGTFGGRTSTFDNNSKSPATLDENIEIADASKRTKAIKITGNALDNSIVGGTNKDTLYGGDGADTLDGGANNDKLYGQAGDDSLFGGAGNDLLNGGDGEDTLWGGSGNDTLVGGNDADVFVYSGGKDVITDYVSGEDAISLGAAYSKASIKGNDVVLTVGKGTLTIKDAKYKEIKFLDGEDYTTERPGVMTVDNSTKTPLTIGEDVEFVDATTRTTDFKVTGNELNNTILGGSGKDAIYGGNGTDSLLGGAGNDKLYGDEGEDTLLGGAGNDTLEGGADDDLFIYSGGKDVIADYVSGEDIISLGAAYTKASVSGNDVILTIKKNNTLTIKNAKYDEITFIDAKGEEYTETFGGVKFDDNSEVKQTLGKGVEFASAKLRASAIEITGNALNNTILGGSGKDILYGEDGEDSLLGGAGADKLYGGDDDDTLVGGTGADSLWGGEGSDTFVYAKGDGKDTINDFGEEDILQITGVDLSEITASKSSNSLVFTIDKSNSITFKKYATDVFNINGDSYEVKGNQLVKTDK